MPISIIYNNEQLNNIIGVVMIRRLFSIATRFNNIVTLKK